MFTVVTNASPVSPTLHQMMMGSAAAISITPPLTMLTRMKVTAVALCIRSPKTTPTSAARTVEWVVWPTRARKLSLESWRRFCPISWMPRKKRPRPRTRALGVDGVMGATPLPSTGRRAQAARFRLGRETGEHDRRRVARQLLERVRPQHRRGQLLVHHQHGQAVDRRPEDESLLRRIAGADPLRAMALADGGRQQIPRRARGPQQRGVIPPAHRRPAHEPVARRLLGREAHDRLRHEIGRASCREREWICG